MESELEGRLATYAKLCSAYADGAYRGRGEAGLATDQVQRVQRKQQQQAEAYAYCYQLSLPLLRAAAMHGECE